MKLILTALGVVASLALIGVSTAMNARFGYSLGSNEIDGWIYACASVAVDLLKVAVPFFAFWYFASTKIVASLVAIVLFLGATGYSLTSAIGFAALNRTEVTGSRAGVHDQYRRLEAELQRQQSQLEKHLNVRPASVVKADLAELELQRRWQTTKKCTDATATKSRQFCATYAQLTGELGSAREAAHLQGAVAKIQTELKQLAREGTALKAVDPQADAFAAITGTDIKDIQLGLALFVAFLMELGSGLGLFVSMHHWSRPTKVQPVEQNFELEVGDIGIFLAEHIQLCSEGTQLSLSDILKRYQEWCRNKGFTAAGNDDFASHLDSLLAEVGVKKVPGRGPRRYKDIKFRAEITLVAQTA